MQIIKRGQLPIERDWKGTCINCSSVIEAKQSELISSQRSDEWKTGNCPVCNNIMKFYPKKN
jgi:hypothetical protein